MTRSVPEHWVERLFSRMASIYGSQRVADMWQGLDMDEVKTTWRAGLAEFNDEALKRGVAALFHEKSPPDLPRFRQLCHPTPQQFVTHTALTDQRHRMTPEGFAQLKRIKGLLMANPAYLPNSHRADGIQWAYKLLDKATRGQANAMQVAFAEDAIRRWKASHHVADREGDDELTDLPRRIPSPHIYGDCEPGSDDEEAAA